jgi:hypothetical protein
MSETETPTTLPPAEVPVTTVAAEPAPSKKENPFQRTRRLALRRRVITIASICLVALSILGGLIYYATRGGILILEADSNFTVLLNGHPAKLIQEKDGVFIRARPGVYRLELSRSGYEPFTADITLGSGKIVKLRPVFSVLPKTTTAANTTIDYVRPSLDGKAVFYLGNNRQTIFRLEIANQIQVPVTIDPINGISDIQWSESQDVALIHLPDGYYLQEIPIYDFTHEVRVKITQQYISSAVWDPNNGDRIAFVYNPPTGEKSLAFSDNRQISSFDRRADIRNLTNPKLVWAPNSNYVLLVNRSGDMSQNNVWIYKTTDGSLNQVTTSGGVLDATFAPDSGTILYETRSVDPTNPLGSSLSVISPDGTNQKDLGLVGKVARTAWKDGSSFYLPDTVQNNLTLYSLKGSTQQIPFSFPSSSIQGMYYAADTKVLLFYTTQSIYLSDLAK